MLRCFVLQSRRVSLEFISPDVPRVGTHWPGLPVNIRDERSGQVVSSINGGGPGLEVKVFDSGGHGHEDFHLKSEASAILDEFDDSEREGVGGSNVERELLSLLHAEATSRAASRS